MKEITQPSQDIDSQMLCIPVVSTCSTYLSNSFLYPEKSSFTGSPWVTKITKIIQPASPQFHNWNT